MTAFLLVTAICCWADMARRFVAYRRRQFAALDNVNKFRDAMGMSKLSMGDAASHVAAGKSIFKP